MIFLDQDSLEDTRETLQEYLLQAVRALLPLQERGSKFCNGPWSFIRCDRVIYSSSGND